VTTSVFYDAEARTVDLAQNADASSGNVTVSTIYTNLNTMLDTGVTLVQQVNNSASTTNPNATFAATPTNGNAMIALVVRGADNVASTNASWTLLTSAGSAGARRLEVWWRRAGASEATLHTWTNGTAALWEVTLIEYGGWAAYADPQTIIAGGNLTSGTIATFTDTGILESVCAVVTSGGSAGTFTNTGTNTESVTDLPFTTTTRFRAMSVDAYTNRPTGQTNQITWTTNRVSTRAQVGWENGAQSQASGAFGRIIGNDAQTATAFAGQVGLRFDTSAIPDVDTVTSATMTLTAYNGTVAWPSNTSVNAYSLAAAAIAADNSNTRAVWKKPTEIQALTRVASRAAGSAWVANTAYTWTSDSTFPAAINKTGNTTILLATGDQQTGTLRSTQEIANISTTLGSVHYLTVIHDLVIARAGGLASAEAVSGVTRLVNVLLRIGGKASDEAFGGIGRFDLTAPIGSITTGEQFGGAALTGLLARVGGIPSAELVAGISSITTQAFQTIDVGSISSGETFGSFTIYKVGGSVVAAHTVTGIVVASAPTVTGLVSAVEALTGVTASTHLLQP